MDVSLVVPAYNEEGEISELVDHLNTLSFFKEIIIVDDGSTDQTAKKGIDRIEENGSNINLVSLKENTDKVGAIATGVGLATADKVVLTDADTRIKNPWQIISIADELDRQDYEGIAFQILPVSDPNNGFIGNIWSLLQDLDYSIGRIAHHFTTSNFLRRHPEDKNVRCVPGAGGIYYRETLLNALEKHSSKHAGDDMETTAIVQLEEEGNISYSNRVQFESKAPPTYRGLLNQRVRWNKGALQAFWQQKKMFLKEIINLSRYGLLSTYELGLSLITPLFFLLIIGLALTNSPDSLFTSVKRLYMIDVTLTSVAAFYSYTKNDLGRRSSLLLLPILPLYRLAIFYPAKIMAGGKFTWEKLQETVKGKQNNVKIPDAEIFEPRTKTRESTLRNKV